MIARVLYPLVTNVNVNIEHIRETGVLLYILYNIIYIMYGIILKVYNSIHYVKNI